METNQQQNGAALATVPASPPAARAVVDVNPQGEIVRLGFDTVAGFEALQRAAKLLASSSLVPEQYRNNVPNAVIAMNMALRLRADPLMVAQNLYVVHGRPGWSAQFYISAFNSCGRFSPIRYRFIGEKGKDTWGCVAWAKELATGEIVEGSEVTIALAKAENWYGKNGSKWQTMPQQMLMYRAASFLVRTVAPEITMGIRTVDELEDIGPEQTEYQAPPPPSVTVVDVAAQAGNAAPEDAPADPLAAAQAELAAAAQE